MGGSEWLCGGLEMEMLWDQVLRCSCMLPNAEGATERTETVDQDCSGTCLVGCLL
jgi:hypothetical protein